MFCDCERTSLADVDAVVTFTKTETATVKAHMHMQLKTVPMPKKFEMGLSPRIEMFNLSQNFG